MKGYRTLAINLAIAVAGVITAFNWGDVLPPTAAMLVTSVVIPLVNIGLRFITTTPVGQSQ